MVLRSRESMQHGLKGSEVQRGEVLRAARPEAVDHHTCHAPMSGRFRPSGRQVCIFTVGMRQKPVVKLPQIFFPGPPSGIQMPLHARLFHCRFLMVLLGEAGLSASTEDGADGRPWRLPRTGRLRRPCASHSRS
eukprot:scaffold731_cov261-Pinguiococcus_pyrenoidosus.AAC.45